MDEVLELEFNMKIGDLMVPTRLDDESRRAPSCVLFGNFMEPHAAVKNY